MDTMLLYSYVHIYICYKSAYMYVYVHILIYIYGFEKMRRKFALSPNVCGKWKCQTFQI